MAARARAHLYAHFMLFYLLQIEKQIHCIAICNKIINEMQINGDHRKTQYSRTELVFIDVTENHSSSWIY